MTSAIHATHVTEDDISTLGRTRTTACFCPSTERDLADGIAPARRLSDAGSPLSLGSDQHAIIDLLEEARGLEMQERLESLQVGGSARTSCCQQRPDTAAWAGPTPGGSRSVPAPILSRSGSAA